jgi:hypothetical protein
MQNSILATLHRDTRLAKVNKGLIWPTIHRDVAYLRSKYSELYSL